MIVKFSTRAGAFVMHGDAAVALLRGMGHSGTVPGAILAADLPAALAVAAAHRHDRDRDRARIRPHVGTGLTQDAGRHFRIGN
jgi:hypothetical protein